MSKARLVITAIEVEGRSPAEVVAAYGVSRSWLYELLARYRAEGDAAFEPRSRRPRSSPGATPAQTVELVLRIRKQLSDAGLDAGAETIGWHLTHHHRTTLSRATIHRILTRSGAVIPDPAKRPKASYLRFPAEMPNETWQSDFTHYARAPDGCEPPRSSVRTRGGAPPEEQGGAPTSVRNGRGCGSSRTYLVSASTRRSTSSSTVPVLGRSRL